MDKSTLYQQIQAKRSFLCVGLDADLHKLPQHLLQTDDPIFEFNKAIIDATKDLCVSYKPNIAFYESLGSKGWLSLEKTLDYIPEEHFVIADAKRGDIGNTGKMYARTYFEHFNVDAVTVAPYMGRDSVVPFLEYQDKWVILLGLTSNEGSIDFQLLNLESGERLYEKVIKTAMDWGSSDQLMFVFGATHPDLLRDIRNIAEDYFFLVPGIGAQGGSLQEVVKNGKGSEINLLVNSSRAIIYADDSEDFQEAVRKQAMSVQQEMSALLG